jgi:hypothetical protein
MANHFPILVAHIDRLKGRENYREWCFDIKNILVIETAWSAIEGYPAEDTTPISIKREKDKKRKSHHLSDIGAPS